MDKYFTLNRDGCSIRCKLYGDAREVRQAVLYCHGFGGHKDTRAAERFAHRFLASTERAAVVCFDWPGHGEDARGRITLDDCTQYQRLMTEHLRERGAEEIFACATSFGGYLTLRYIARNGNPYRKIALRSPAVNIYEVINGAIMTEENRADLARGRTTAVGFDRKVRVSPAFLESLRAEDITKLDFRPFREEILIVHGTEDEVVPFAAAEDFARRNEIAFIPSEGADHRFIDPAKMNAAIGRFTDFFLE